MSELINSSSCCSASLSIGKQTDKQNANQLFNRRRRTNCCRLENKQINYNNDNNSNSHGNSSNDNNNKNNSKAVKNQSVCFNGKQQDAAGISCFNQGGENVKKFPCFLMRNNDRLFSILSVSRRTAASAPSRVYHSTFIIFQLRSITRSYIQKYMSEFLFCRQNEPIL